MATAKKIARREVYKGYATTFYCGCPYTAKGSSGGTIKARNCGYKPRKSAARGRRLEWEHVMPAKILWGSDRCWTTGHERCIRNGTSHRGRGCCAKVDESFRVAEADLHNLVPAVGELNADRGDKPYGVIEAERRAYGACGFEIDFDDDRVEPSERIQGNVARIWFYMAETYNVDLDESTTTLLLAWASADPPDAWEIERDRRIKELQGNSNPYVSDPACNGESAPVRFPCE